MVDGLRRFISVSLGHPGIFHDGRVFRRSALFNQLENYEVLRGPTVVYNN